MMQSGMNPFTKEEQGIIQMMKVIVGEMLDSSQIRGLLQDSDLKDLVVAGGVFTSLYHESKERVKDVDIFILNDNKVLWNNLHINHFLRSDCVTHERSSLPNASHSYFADNDNILATAFNPRSKLQIILTAYKSRQELIEHFDFKHTRVSLYPIFTASSLGTQFDPKLHISQVTYNAIRNKHLIPARKDGKVQAWRKMKFLSRGFIVPDAEHSMLISSAWNTQGVTFQAQPVKRSPSW